MEPPAYQQTSAPPREWKLFGSLQSLTARRRPRWPGSLRSWYCWATPRQPMCQSQRPGIGRPFPWAPAAPHTAITHNGLVLDAFVESTVVALCQTEPAGTPCSSTETHHRSNGADPNPGSPCASKPYTSNQHSPFLIESD
jgi:hypothetical protein